MFPKKTWIFRQKMIFHEHADCAVFGKIGAGSLQTTPTTAYGGHFGNPNGIFAYGPRCAPGGAAAMLCVAGHDQIEMKQGASFCKNRKKLGRKRSRPRPSKRPLGEVRFSRKVIYRAEREISIFKSSANGGGFHRLKTFSAALKKLVRESQIAHPASAARPRANRS